MRWRRTSGHLATARGQLKASTPSLIRSYPQRSVQYGFPTQLSRYKKDYLLLKDYGALYNARVLGLRQPASPGKDLRQTFEDYQTMAQELGRP